MQKYLTAGMQMTVRFTPIWRVLIITVAGMVDFVLLGQTPVGKSF